MTEPQKYACADCKHCSEHRCNLVHVRVSESLPIACLEFTPRYPEHEKMKKVREASHAIGQFLEWLASGEAHDDGKPIMLAYYYDDAALEQMPCTIERLLARYFGIDLELIAAEKDAMIADLREAQRRLFDPSLEDNTPAES